MSDPKESKGCFTIVVLLFGALATGNLVATIRADSLGWQIFSGILTVFMIAGLGALIATENNT